MSYNRFSVSLAKPFVDDETRKGPQSRGETSLPTNQPSPRSGLLATFLRHYCGSLASETLPSEAARGCQGSGKAIAPCRRLVVGNLQHEPLHVGNMYTIGAVHNEISFNP